MSTPSAEPTSPTTSETIETLLNRVSVRRFTNKPVDRDVVEAVLRAAFRAPTSSNIQSYSVVVVRDPETRAKLAVPAGNQIHIVQAPVFLAFCADMTRIAYAMDKHGAKLEENNLEMGLVTSIDAALVGMAAYVAADSLGLKGVMIGAMRNKPLEIAEILGLPRHVYCVYGMCLGWPADIPQQKPRMDYDGVVHYESYGQTEDGLAMSEMVDTYDATLARHYRSIGKPTADDSWTTEVFKKFDTQPRENLRADLKKLGFDFR